MQKNTENRKKRAPIIIAGAFIGFLGIVLAAMIFPLIDQACGELLTVLILLIYGGMIAATIVGVILALRQRLKEIESGEEADAKQY